MNNRICPYCHNEIRPLDHHVVQIKPEPIKDPVGETFILVTCQLSRYYLVTPVEQK